MTNSYPLEPRVLERTFIQFLIYYFKYDVHFAHCIQMRHVSLK